MRVAVYGVNGPLDEIVETALVAEELGFDGLLVGEHHQQPMLHFPSPLPLLAALAARTTRIRLGTSVLLLPLYHAVHVAEDVAEIDRVSGGRLDLGVGLGYQPIDFDTFGTPIKNRVSLLEEGVEVLRRFWTGERFSFEGKRYRLKDVLPHPQPVQPGGPPLWLAGWTPEGVRRAGRLGNGWVTDPIQPLPVIKQFAAEYRAAAQQAGRRPFISLMREVLIAPTSQEAVARYAQGLVRTYQYYWQNKAFNEDLEPWVKEINSPDEITFERVAKDRAIVGGPAEVAADILRWQQEIGADHLQIIIPAQGKELHEALKLFASEVSPTLT
jgi:probable F420-dependent oxidoreductase